MMSRLSFGPLLLRFPLHSRRRRLLELQPVRRPARTVARSQPLRNDPLEANPAGVLKDGQPVRVLEVLSFNSFAMAYLRISSDAFFRSAPLPERQRPLAGC